MRAFQWDEETRDRLSKFCRQHITYESIAVRVGTDARGSQCSTETARKEALRLGLRCRRAYRDPVKREPPQQAAQPAPAPKPVKRYLAGPSLPPLPSLLEPMVKVAL